MNILDKIAIHTIAIEVLNQRLQKIQLAFDELNQSLQTNTKSSAGDKHETGRAMTQLEQEKLSKQLTVTKDLLQGIKKINPSEQHSQIGFGSLFSTETGHFFISSAIGAIETDKVSVFCLSPLSPLAKAFNGKKLGEDVSFNGKNYVVTFLT